MKTVKILLNCKEIKESPSAFLILNFMMKNKHLLLLIGFLLIIISTTEYGCKHEPVLISEIPEDCITEDINFWPTVDSILGNNCYGCHSGITPNGGVNLTDFNVLAALVVNGKLSGVINRESGYSPMPPGFALDECSVKQIDNWIADTAATIMGDCDTLNVTYAGTVYPILQANCISCHSGETPAGNLDFTDYEQVSIVAQNGALMGSIQHLEGYSPMPQNSPKLDDCSIAQIGIWVRDTTFTPPGGGGNDYPCDPDTAYFQNQILPLLISNCATTDCHDGSSEDNDVVLVDYASVMQTGKVKPGDPFDSKLYKVLVKEEPDDRMPPPPAEALSTEQTELVKKWILQGALDNFCQEDCDTTNVTFSTSVWPTLETNCVGCHSGATPAGEIPITNYNEVVAIATNGKLLGAIRHETGFSPMPKNGAKLIDCKIREIEIWIEDGTPDN